MVYNNCCGEYREQSPFLKMDFPAVDYSLFSQNHEQISAFKSRLKPKWFCDLIKISSDW